MEPLDHLTRPARGLSRDARPRAGRILATALATLFLVAAIPLETARGQGYTFIQYLPAQGLSQSQVTCLMQDSTGYLWIGTVAGGLNRFDGHTFTSYRWSEGLRAVFIRALAEHRGKLYVGTRSGLFRQERDRFEAIGFQSHQPLDIYDLTITPNNELLVSTNSGLFHLDGARLEPDPRGQLLPQGSVHDAVFSPRGELWVMGRDWKTGSYWLGCIRGLTFNPVRLEEGMVVEAILPDPAGGLWVATRSGLYHTEGRALRPALPETAWFRQPIASLYQGPGGKLWAGSWHGVATVENGTVTVFDFNVGFPPVRVRAMLQDRESNAYFGTDGEGLLQLPPQPFARYAVPPMEDYAAMRTVLDGRGRRWIATFGQGLWYVKSGAAHRVGASLGQALLDCTALLLNDDGTLWVGTNTGGLFEVTLDDTLQIRSIPEVGVSSILHLMALDGRRFVANDEGLSVLENGAWQRYGTDEGLPSHYPTFLEPSRDGTLWVGTYDQGLFRWDPGTREVVEHLTLDQGLPGRSVTSILEARDGTLYIGTYQGLVRRRGQTLEVLGRKEGLPDDTINFIIQEPDTQRLWIGTNRGIAREIDGGWRTFTHRQGLPDDETNTNAAYWDEQGRLWIGTIHGFAVLVRRPPPLNPVPPPVVIQQVWEHERPIDPRAKGVTFAHDQNRLRFRFAGLSFVDPSRVRYRYRLMGLEDAEWTETVQSEVSFAALDDGTYTFEVMACNNDGLWSEEPARFSFIIEPPFWETWWARVLQVGTVLLAGVLFYTVRMSRVIRQNEWLEQQVEDRTFALKREKERSERLLLNILPAPIAGELMERGVAAPRLYAEVTILLADFQDFTRSCADLTPGEVAAELEEIFTAFDEICRVHRLERLKTIGDSFLAASGLPVKNPHHAREAVEAALEMQEYLESRAQTPGKKPLQVRIGIHSGPVVAGVIGSWKFAYDIWGDAVNTATRMEALGQPGRVNISRNTYELVREHFVCESRGHVAVEGKGTLEMFFVKARRTRLPNGQR